MFRDKRNALTTAERSKLDDLLLIRFQAIDLPLISNVLSYWPIEEHNEPNTHLLTRFLEFQFPGLRILYPQTDFATNTMKAIWVNENTRFAKNQFNIYEPQDGEIADPQKVDMVIVPLLVVDRQGYRAGFGKGLYDRYLENCRNDCLKTGFSYFEPVESIDDHHQFDVPLNLCITPQTVYVF